MTSKHSRALSVAVLIAVTTFFGGCRQPQQEPARQEPLNERQARLLAVQSADLQQQLTARQVEMEALRQKHVQDLQQRDDEVARCKARIELLQKDVEKGIADRVEKVTAAIAEENARLRKEVAELKAQVEKLKAASADEIRP